MREPLKHTTGFLEPQPKANVRKDLKIRPWAVCLVGVSILFATEAAFLWFFFISPYNIFFRLALLLTSLAIVTCLFLPRFRKFRLCFAGLTLLGASFLATPVAWDDRIASARYGIQVEKFPASLGITKTTEQIGFASGESIGIERGQVPGQPLYIFKMFEDGGCYLQMTNISSEFILRYGVCPSAITGLSVNKYFFRFW